MEKWQVEDIVEFLLRKGYVWVKNKNMFDWYSNITGRHMIEHFTIRKIVGLKKQEYSANIDELRFCLFKDYDLILSFSDDWVRFLLKKYPEKADFYISKCKSIIAYNELCNKQDKHMSEERKQHVAKDLEKWNKIIKYAEEIKAKNQHTKNEGKI